MVNCIDHICLTSMIRTCIVLERWSLIYSGFKPQILLYRYFWFYTTYWPNYIGSFCPCFQYNLVRMLETKVYLILVTKTVSNRTKHCLLSFIVCFMSTVSVSFLLMSFRMHPWHSPGATGFSSQLSYWNDMCATCLERVLNILYCSLTIAFQHFYLYAAPFMGTGKIPFTSSQEQSGSHGCDVPQHLGPQSVSPRLFGSFMGLIYWQAVAIWYYWMDGSLVCYVCKYYVEVLDL